MADGRERSTAQKVAAVVARDAQHAGSAVKATGTCRRVADRHRGRGRSTGKSEEGAGRGLGAVLAARAAATAWLERRTAVTAAS